MSAHPPQPDRPFMSHDMFAVLVAIALLLPMRAGADQGSAETNKPDSAAPDSEIVLLEIQSEIYGNTRKLRVLLPPSYRRTNADYPVFYFLDGMATMDERGLNLPAILKQQRSDAALREFIVVGIDNGGSTSTTTYPSVDRASEYIPYPDPSWTEPPVPKPKGQLFPTFLFDEVKPLISQKFRVASGPDNVGLGGTSYGGLATLHTLIHHPDRIGLAMIESPSLHVSQGPLEQQLNRIENWKGKIHLGVGSAEGELLEHQREMTANVLSLASLLYESAPNAELNFAFVNGGTHWYDAWRTRLPEAIQFLLKCDSVGLPGCSGLD